MQNQYPTVYEEDALPGFSLFRYITRKEGGLGISVEEFGYQANSRQLLNAFARRYRVACKMQGQEYDGFGESTSKGYAALNRHFMMFSAFERYAQDCEGIESRAYEKALSTLPEGHFKPIADFLKAEDEKAVVWNFLLKERINPYQASSLLSFRNGLQPKKAIYLSAMLRNTFAHGTLTAHPTGSKVGAVENIANYMRQFLLFALRTDFQIRLKAYCEKNNIQGYPEPDLEFNYLP